MFCRKFNMYVFEVFHINMFQCFRQRATSLTKSISCWIVNWWWKGLGHQQEWFVNSVLKKIQTPYEKDYKPYIWQTSWYIWLCFPDHCTWSTFDEQNLGLFQYWQNWLYIEYWMGTAAEISHWDLLSAAQCGLVPPYGDIELGQHWLR